jgi:hypothetical protein
LFIIDLFFIIFFVIIIWEIIEVFFMLLGTIEYVSIKEN